MRTAKKVLLTMAAVLGFVSQAGSKTQITLDQIAAPPANTVMVSVSGKGWTPAQLDPSLVLDTTTNPPILKAPGGGQPVFVDAVTPTGTVDGINATFILPSSPNPALSLELTVNGLTDSTGADFNVSGATVTFLPGAVPSSGSLLRASYRR